MLIMSQNLYRLIYFDGRGRAELIRLIFAVANKPYEDVRVHVKDWPDMKSGMFYSWRFSGNSMIKIDKSHNSLFCP